VIEIERAFAGNDPSERKRRDRGASSSRYGVEHVIADNGGAADDPDMGPVPDLVDGGRRDQVVFDKKKMFG